MHKDSAGYEVSLERGKLMVMNAGKNFWHEEKVKKEGVEMLQIFMRPEAPDLEPKIQFHDKPMDNDDWYLMIGPEDSEAPMTMRQNAYIMDAHIKAGQTLDIPHYKGLAPFLYVMHGEIEIGNETVKRFEAVADVDEALPPLKALEASTVVLFLVDLDAPMSTKGTISSLRRY